MPRNDARLERLCYIHIGTHKTGTTSLQDWFALNVAKFAAADVLLARSGNPLEAGNPGYVGNHNLAFELIGDSRFHPRYGTVADLRNELIASPYTHALISCEDFGLLHNWIERAEPLREAVLAAGYRPVIIAYFREQAAYAQSLYAMFARRRFSIDFDAFIELIFSESQEWGVHLHAFDYDRVLDPMAACFGAANVIARPYRSYAGDDYLRADFVSLIRGSDPLDASTFVPNPRLNTAGSYRDILSALHAKRTNGESGAGTIAEIAARAGVRKTLLDEPFYTIGPEVAARFRDRFAASNADILTRYGLEIEPHRPPPAEAWHERRALLDACDAARSAGERYENAAP